MTQRFGALSRLGLELQILNFIQMSNSITNIELTTNAQMDSSPCCAMPLLSIIINK